jgi:phenylalanyl-tRNA synthetase beta chain
MKLGGLLWGSSNTEQWGRPARSVDFYDVKGDVENLLAMSNDAGDFTILKAEHPALQTGQSACVMRGSHQVGWLGALNPRIQQNLDIPGKVYLFELDAEVIRAASLTRVTALSRFPSVRRDLAIIVDTTLAFSELEAVLRGQGGDNLESIVLFDVYQGDKIASSKKSLALGLTFQHPSRTLQDEEVNDIINSCIKVLEEQFNAELR